MDCWAERHQALVQALSEDFGKCENIQVGFEAAANTNRGFAGLVGSLVEFRK